MLLTAKADHDRNTDAVTITVVLGKNTHAVATEQVTTEADLGDRNVGTFTVVLGKKTHAVTTEADLGRNTDVVTIKADWSSNTSPNTVEATIKNKPYRLLPEGRTPTSTPAARALLSLYDGSEQEIVQALRLYGKDKVADRVVDLYGLHAEDASEDRLDIESLRNLARFMTSYPHLPDPDISVSPDGHAVVEWGRDYGILAIEFTAVGTTRYAALPRMEGHEHLRLSGEKPASQMMEATSPFTKMLV